MSGEQSYFQLHHGPTANTREQSTRIGVPWGKVPDTLGLLGEARQTDQDSGVPAGLLGNLTHQVQSPAMHKATTCHSSFPGKKLKGRDFLV